MSAGAINSKWTCELCTFSNGSDKARCDMCLTPKPSPSQSNHYVNGDRDAINHNHSHNHNPNPNHNPNDDDNENIGKVPDISMVPQHIEFAPKDKAIPQQSIFERWMIAQMQRASGEQPSICIENGVLLSNLRRVRGPTTYQSIQQQINDNTSAMIHANNLDAGDFTDDEEEELSAFATSPRSITQTFSSGNLTSDDEHALSSYSVSPHLTYRSHSRQNSYNKPLPHRANATKHKQSKSTHSIIAKRPIKRAKSHFGFNHKRRVKANVTVSQLWFKSQSQLQEGRNPGILAKYNITLSNIRQHNPRFQDFQRRKSHHDKAASYLHNINIMDNHRKSIIIQDDDDDEEDTDYDTSYEYVYNDNDNENYYDENVFIE